MAKNSSSSPAVTWTDEIITEYIDDNSWRYETEHFLNAIYEEFEYSYDRFFERTGIDRDIALNYLRNEKKDFIYNYYQLRKPECL